MALKSQGMVPALGGGTRIVDPLAFHRSGGASIAAY